MELIVVIAILGVLMAVLIPQYIQYVEKSRKGVCNFNCATVEREIRIVQMTADGSFTLANAQTILGSREDEICPSDGGVTLKLVEGTYEVACSEHGRKSTFERAEEIVPGEIGKNPNIDGIRLIEEYYKQNGNTLDPLTGKEKALLGEKLSSGTSADDLYWRPSKLTVNGKQTYIMFAGSGNADNQAQWKGHLLYYNGTYYKSANVNSSNNTVNPAGVAFSNNNYTAATLAQYLEDQGWVPA